MQAIIAMIIGAVVHKNHAFVQIEFSCGYCINNIPTFPGINQYDRAY